jgi:Mrp family chromosome partitioning ATPase
VALGALKRTNVNILGVIINKLRTRRFGYDYQYPYYYYYSYRQYYGQPEDSEKSSGVLGIPKRVFGKARGVFSSKKKH